MTRSAIYASQMLQNSIINIMTITTAAVTSLAVIMASGAFIASSSSSIPIMLSVDNNLSSSHTNKTSTTTSISNYSSTTISTLLLNQIGNGNNGYSNLIINGYNEKMLRHNHFSNGNKPNKTILLSTSSSPLASNSGSFYSGATICIHRLCIRQNGHHQPSSGVEICYNDKGDMVKHGEQYIPLGIDTCTQCTCMHGKAEMCISVLCSPPENCRRYHEVTNKCCEFLCIDGGNGGIGGDTVRMMTGNPHLGGHTTTTIINSSGASGSSNGLRFFSNKTILAKGETKTFHSISTSNLGLRLITSTVTSFLILALLLFMIHRLRQRRLLMMIRRLQSRRLEQFNSRSSHPPGGPDPHPSDFHSGYSRSSDQVITTPIHLFGLGSDGGHSSLISRGSGGGPFGPFGPFDFGPAIEPPPPYTFWKPPTATTESQQQYISAIPNDPQPIPNEAPPSYEESINVNNSMPATRMIMSYNHHQNLQNNHHMTSILSLSPRSNQQSAIATTTNIEPQLALANGQLQPQSNNLIQQPGHIYPGHGITILTQQQHHPQQDFFTLNNGTGIIRMNTQSPSAIDRQQQQTFTKQINHSNSSSSTISSLNISNDLVHHNSVPESDSRQQLHLKKSQPLIYRQQLLGRGVRGSRNNLHYPQRLVSHLDSSQIIAATEANNNDTPSHYQLAIARPQQEQHITILRVGNTANMTQQRSNRITELVDATSSCQTTLQQPPLPQNPSLKIGHSRQSSMVSTITKSSSSNRIMIPTDGYFNYEQQNYHPTNEQSFESLSSFCETTIIPDHNLLNRGQQLQDSSDPLKKTGRKKPQDNFLIETVIDAANPEMVNGATLNNANTIVQQQQITATITPTSPSSSSETSSQCTVVKQIINQPNNNNSNSKTTSIQNQHATPLQQPYTASSSHRHHRRKSTSTTNSTTKKPLSDKHKMNQSSYSSFSSSSTDSSSSSDASLSSPSRTSSSSSSSSLSSASMRQSNIIHVKVDAISHL